MAYSVCVFCGARGGNDVVFADIADAFGRELGERGMSLVYGGGNVGLMGRLADAVLDCDGTVVGVIPEFLSDREVLHTGISECITVDDLFDRKAVMIEKSDAFVALPGGIGTYDEIIEVIAWRQLKQLRQPIGLLNANGFFEPFLALLAHTVECGFLREDEISHIHVETNAMALIDALQSDASDSTL